MQNDGTVVGLDNPQSVADFISEKVNAHLDPLPEWSLIPHEIEGKAVIEAAVKEGNQTPYYLNLDGTRITGRWRPNVATLFWRRCSLSWTIWRSEAAD